MASENFSKRKTRTAKNVIESESDDLCVFSDVIVEQVRKKGRYVDENLLAVNNSTKENKLREQRAVKVAAPKTRDTFKNFEFESERKVKYYATGNRKKQYIHLSTANSDDSIQEIPAPPKSRPLLIDIADSGNESDVSLSENENSSDSSSSNSDSDEIECQIINVDNKEKGNDSEWIAEKGLGDNAASLDAKSEDTPHKYKTDVSDEYFFQPMSKKMKMFYNDSWGGEHFSARKIRRKMASK